MSFGLDRRYVIASDLQTPLRHKDTGAPLVNGTITFYQDNARTTPKNVYILSGTQPNYTYTSIGNVVTLGAAGTPQYNNNDVIIYYFPYDGTASTSEGNVELYYAEVKDSGGALQFTRQAWPNLIVEEGGSNNDLKNYIPNGQFLLHNNIPAVGTLVAGEIRAGSTILGPGNWTFDRPAGSTAKDIVTFERFNSYVGNPTGNPRYKIKVNNQTVGGGDLYKDIRVRFNNVNKFASTVNYLTFSMTTLNEDQGADDVQLILIKNFGTGGSATTETVLTTFTVNTTTEIKNYSFIIGDNDGKTIGANDDDFLQFAIRLPLASGFNLSFTDFILTDGNITITAYPNTTNKQDLYHSMFDTLPDFNQNYLYLPIRLGLNGLEFDESDVGTIVTESAPRNYTDSINTQTNLIICDGKELQKAQYSSLGIPYARLWQKMVDGGQIESSTNICVYGNGTSYLTANLANISPATTLRITTNQASSVTNASQGTTTFTVANIHKKSDANGYGVQSNVRADDVFNIINNNKGFVTAAALGAGPFNVNEILNSADLRQYVEIGVTALPAGGDYFIFNSTSTAYYVWYTINGAGTNPSPASRTEIKVELLSTDTLEDAVRATREALNGFQVTRVVCLAASSITAGQYFTINTTSVNYYVWYKKDGGGTDPNVSSATGIQVDILSADTAEQVASKTQKAINEKFFQVPDLRDAFIRGFSVDEVWDLDAADRWTKTSQKYGNLVGSLEYFEVNQHLHDFVPLNETNTAGGSKMYWSGDGTSGTSQTANYGGTETRPVNMKMQFAIRY